MTGPDHVCDLRAGWSCDDGEVYGPCTELAPFDECQDPGCGRFAGYCPCDCHEKEDGR